MVVHGVDIASLSKDQRIELLEELSASLDQEETASIPASHRAELDRRKAALRAGEMEILDFDEVMDSL